MKKYEKPMLMGLDRDETTAGVCSVGTGPSTSKQCTTGVNAAGWGSSGSCALGIEANGVRPSCQSGDAASQGCGTGNAG